MSILAEKKVWTPEELLALPDEKDYELVNGELVERNMGTESSWVGGQLFGRLLSYNAEAQLGWLLPSDASFQCFGEDPNKVRRADVSLVRYERLPPTTLPLGHCPAAPNLAVEVVSPNDLYTELESKVGEYLSAGVELVWVINPVKRRAQVFRADGSYARLGEDDVLDGETILPGFRCRLGDILLPLKPPTKRPSRRR